MIDNIFYNVELDQLLYIKSINCYLDGYHHVFLKIKEDFYYGTLLDEFINEYNIGNYIHIGKL